MKQWIIIILMSAFIGAGCNKNIIPEDTTPPEQIITSKEYIFRAETANPMGGRSVRLTYGYDLVIRPGEVVATLPYYGRAYTADRNFSGVRFTSAAYSYKATSDNEGNWDILIKPDDVPEIQEMRLSVTRDGYATLHVTSTNRQPISYYGKIQKQ